MKTAFSVATRIRATPERVFWFLADPSTASVIDPAVRSYEPEGETMGLGVRNHIRMKMLGVPVKLMSETIEWKPGSRMGFRSIKPRRTVIGVATIVRAMSGGHLVHVVDGLCFDRCWRAAGSGFKRCSPWAQCHRSRRTRAKSARGRHRAGPTTDVAHR